jgi:hypothetical protein
MEEGTEKSKWLIALEPFPSMSMPFVRMGKVQGVGSFVLRLVVYFPDWSSAFGGRFPAVFIFRGHSGLPAW